MPLIHDIRDAFTAAEADALIALAGAGPSEAGPVWGEGGYRVDPEYRNVATALRTRDEAGWAFDRLDAVFRGAGAALGVSVRPLTEPVQILRYDVGCHFRTWHSDAGYDRGAGRVLSVSVELSEPGDYDGGLLEIVPDTVGRPRSLPRGGARFFPSRALHRLTPVTRGTRWALVAWTGGG